MLAVTKPKKTKAMPSKAGPATVEPMLEFLCRFTAVLGSMLGPEVEVVVHDLRQPESSIVALANGHITGRKIGDSIDALGLELIRKQSFKDLVNYEALTRNGKQLRSSSVFLENADGEVVASLCINQDITRLRLLKDWLDRTLEPPAPANESSSEVTEERFERSVDEVLNRLIDEAVQRTGKPVGTLKREDKIEIIRHLESKGAFLIRYSMDIVADLLEMSKYTIYNYLQERSTGYDSSRSEEHARKPAKTASRARTNGASKPGVNSRTKTKR